MISYSLKHLKKTFLNKYYWKSVLTIIKADYKLSYGTSFLGNFWMLIRPMILISVYAVIFSRIARFPGMNNYAFFLTTNLVLWFLISSIISLSAESIAKRANIIKLCPIPKTIFIIVDILIQMRIYFISLSIIYVLLGIFLDIEAHLTLLLFPLYFFILFIILICIASSLAYLCPYVKDIKTLIESSILALLWLTPVIYPQGALGEKLSEILKFNPLAIMVTPFTKIIYYGQVPNMFDNIALLILLISTSLLALLIHKRLSRNVVYYL